jgi:hypothetical protein
MKNNYTATTIGDHAILKKQKLYSEMAARNGHSLMILPIYARGGFHNSTANFAKKVAAEVGGEAGRLLQMIRAAVDQNQALILLESERKLVGANHEATRQKLERVRQQQQARRSASSARDDQDEPDPADPCAGLDAEAEAEFIATIEGDERPQVAQRLSQVIPERERSRPLPDQNDDDDMNQTPGPNRRIVVNRTSSSAQPPRRSWYDNVFAFLQPSTGNTTSPSSATAVEVRA